MWMCPGRPSYATGIGPSKRNLPDLSAMTATTTRIPSGRGYPRRVPSRKSRSSGDDDRDCRPRGVVPAQVVEQHVEAGGEIDSCRPLLAGRDHDRRRGSLADRAPALDRELLAPALGRNDIELVTESSEVLDRLPQGAR